MNERYKIIYFSSFGALLLGGLGKMSIMSYKTLTLFAWPIAGSLIFAPALAQEVPSQNRPTTQTPSYDEQSIEEDYETIPLIEATEWIFTTGYDYSSGQFNLPASTNISYIPYSLRYNDGQWSFRASSGYISFAGPRNVITAVEGAPLVTDVELSQNDRRRSPRKSGFGDVYLSGSYSLENPYFSDLMIDLTGQVKLPTADENRGLGTGKVDLAIKADVSYLFGNFMPYGTVGYRFVGKSERYDLQNTFFASVGASYFLTYDTSVGVSYEYRESATPGFNSPKEIFAYTDVQINDHWGVNFYGVVGLNNVTTDYGLGTQIRYKF